MAVFSVIFFYTIFFFFSRQGSANAFVSGEKQVLDTRFDQVLSLDSLVSSPSCRSTANPGTGLGYGAAVVSSRGPCSPSTSPAAATLDEKATGGQGNDPKVGISNDLSDYQYLVQVGIGTPTRSLALIMDTGSDIIWTYCGFCTVQSCYKFRRFNLIGPAASASFSWYCEKPALYFTPDCEYSISYLDQSTSVGYTATDVLTVGTSYRVQSFIFGCGERITSDFGKADGVLGLKMAGRYTFISQTASALKKTFCYCIPPTDSLQGYLYFGDGARTNCQTQTSTPLIDKNDYAVALLGLTVGNLTLNFAELSSPIRTIVDSGTYLTRLPPQVYKVLRRKFQEYMSGYPVASSKDLAMDTCYRIADYKSVILPVIVLHFDRANVTLDPAGVVSQESKSRICLAFAENKLLSDTNIFGSAQMKKLDVLFDVNDGTIGFGRGSCGT